MMIFAFGIRTRGEFAWDHLPVHVVPSHVMGTFGTNRIYSVGRMVKVADRMRWGFTPAWVRFPPYLKCKNHQ